MQNTKAIIKKWYERLGFPKEFDAEFHTALENIDIPNDVTIETYDKNTDDGKRNLLTFLYFCEGLEAKYKALGIPEEILIDTLLDIPRWTKTWSSVKGTLYLGELPWLNHHFTMKIFKLGRLQFYLGYAGGDIPVANVRTGDAVLDVHIPSDGKLTPEECYRSFDKAREFFPKYFPEHKFKCFTCHSWLLDDTLKKYLPSDSNIIKFGDMFTKLREDVRLDLIRYMFTWDTTKENLPERVPKGKTAERIKAAVLAGEEFHSTFGVIPL